MRDRYWHIQMFLPGGTVIDSSQMLKEDMPVIGTGKWDDIQCQYFKGERNGLAIGDIVMVREGSRPLALCKVKGDCFHDDSLTNKYINYWFRYVEILEWADPNEWNSLFSQGTLKILYKHSDTPSWHYINDWYKRISQSADMEKITDLLLYKKQIILQGAPGTGKTYTAKDIAEQLIFDKISNTKKEQKEKLAKSDQYKLVQFHPSYTYEDFVRGIVVETENGQPEYIAKNKILAEFARQAKESWDLYNLEKENRVKEVLQAKSKFDQFIDNIQIKIDEDGKFQLTPNVYLFEYDDRRFKYKGDNWEAHANGLNMKYSELKKVFDSGFIDRPDIRKLPDVESLTSQHATYYTKMAEKYSQYKPKEILDISTNNELQNYVLIIDEINRANLPAVLGELIYALEYRSESVESMYVVDGDKSLVIPPNLYIIGTMNTADRSVGQIDYAIRRRFAFFDMLPKELEEDGFDKGLFKKASELFIKGYDEYIANSKNDKDIPLERSEYLSEEFRPEDVWLGHSYFLMKDKDGKDIRDMRLKYEIKPILKEYLKDGIFKVSAEEIINSLV